MTKKKKRWLWTGLVLPLIVGIILVVLEKLLDLKLLSGAWRLIKGVGEFFLDTVSVPIWLVILLPVAGAGAVIGLQVLARRRRKKDEVSSHAYTRDRIFDIDWVWEWVGDEIKISYGLCPRCEYEIDLGFIRASSVSENYPISNKRRFFGPK